MSKTNVHPNSPCPPLTNQSSSQPQRSKVIHCTNSSSTSKPPTQPTRKPQSAKSILLLLDNFSLYSGSTKKSTKTNSSKTTTTTALPLSTKPISHFTAIDEQPPHETKQSKTCLLSPIYSTTAIIPHKPDIHSYPTSLGQGLPFNVDELLLIEEKIINIISSLKNSQPYVCNDCIEWWNCYFVSFICNGTLTNLINDHNNNEHKAMINNVSNVFMYSIIITYYNKQLSTSENVVNDINIDLVLYHHRLYLLICKYVLTLFDNAQTTIEEYITINKINKQIACYLKHTSEHKVTSIINEMKVYLNYLLDVISKFILHLRSDTGMSLITLDHLSCDKLFNLFYNLKHTTPNELNDFFIRSFLQHPSLNISLLSNNNTINDSNQPSIPYLKYKPTKPFTLVLDLDETLIHFKYDKVNDPQITQGIVQYRPGLFEFLNNIRKHYELVIFTVGTKQYADKVIDSIENQTTYFSYRLYREHTSIYNNDFIKDISRLGRDLSKVVIVDDKPFNFILHKDNGIAIRPYWGNDTTTQTNDVALLNLLTILIDIIKYKYVDIREGIKKYRNDIVNKVSSDIYKNNIFN